MSPRRIIPNIWFHGNAQEAGEFYAVALPETTSRVAVLYPQEGPPDFQSRRQGLSPRPDQRRAGVHADPSISFILTLDPRQFGGDAAARAPFSALDSPVEHAFEFTCGISYEVRCAGQAESDRLWEALSAVPAAEQCGWLADPFGVSWQIVPDNLDELMARQNAYANLMGMHKIVIADF